MQDIKGRREQTTEKLDGFLDQLGYTSDSASMEEATRSR
jgi:hypothetical protein